MTRTFFAASTVAQSLAIDEIHVNVWFINRSKIFCDIGMQVLVDNNVILEKREIDLECHLPFAYKDKSVKDLYEYIDEPEVLRLVFNEEPQSTENISSRMGFGDKPCIVSRFVTRGNVIIRPVDIDLSGGRKDILKMKMVLNNINADRLSGIFGDGKTKVYIRIRYQVETQDDANIYYLKRSFHEQIHIDFRFNEERLLSSNVNPSSILAINNVFIFIQDFRLSFK